MDTWWTAFGWESLKSIYFAFFLLLWVWDGGEEGRREREGVFVGRINSGEVEVRRSSGVSTRWKIFDTEGS